MDTARADTLAARDHLRMQGWIAPRNESFRHLPPPGANTWLEGPAGNAEPACDAPPLAGAGWTLSRSCFTSSSGGSLCADADWPRRGLNLTGDGLPLSLNATPAQIKLGARYQQAWLRTFTQDCFS